MVWKQTQDIPAGDMLIEPDVPELPIGIYFIGLENEKGTVNESYRLVKVEP